MWNKRRITPYIPTLRSKEDRKKCIVNSAVLSTTEFYSPTPLDDFYVVDHEHIGKLPSKRMTSDIYMLFNQQRLDRMSREALINYFNGLAIQDPKFGDLKSKLSDDQLISVVKSRYIQSPSELLAWSRYLNTLGDEILAALPAQDPVQDPVQDPAQDPALNP